MTLKSILALAICFIACADYAASPGNVSDAKISAATKPAHDSIATPTPVSATVSLNDSVKEETEKPASRKPAVKVGKVGKVEHGKATFYGKKWHGRRTSSGERLDNYAYQCAHKTLPFGTLVKVTNKKNGKSCVVKVVDRGPFGRGMVIDLTHQAARHIGMLRDGVVSVSLETLHPDTKVENGEIVEIEES